MKDPKPDFVIKFKEISNVLIDYGWFITPYITGGEFDTIYKYSQSIKTNPPDNEQRRKEVSNHINSLFTDVIFHPNYRAFFIYRSKELKHISEYSHYFEKAIFHYYKQDFFSCTLCLLPAIEGVLLSYYGWSYSNGRKPSIKNLLEKIQNSSFISDLPERYNMYKDALLIFLNKWIFADTKSADMSISFLNRHYVLHGMGNESFYTISDCHRLILLFDLIIEFLSLEEKKYYIFIPDDKLTINLRREYYLSLIENDPSNKIMIRFEGELLKENKNFKIEENPPEWSNIQLKAMLDMLLFLNRNENKKKET